jgi:hypothetical protein
MTYPDEMFDEAERKALEALDKLYEENSDALKRLAKIEKKNIDEFVLEDIKMLHYEVMSPEHIWMGITCNNGQYYHLNIHGRNIRTYLTDETIHP